MWHLKTITNDQWVLKTPQIHNSGSQQQKRVQLKYLSQRLNLDKYVLTQNVKIKITTKLQQNQYMSSMNRKSED